ncbi:MAG: hypothetical protein ABL966_03175 [Acidimicrobiales bacterium]
MAPRAVGPVSRRQVLLGGSAFAGAVLLGACGSDDESGEAPSTTGASSELSLVQFFSGPMLTAGTEVRAPFGLADAEGLLLPDATPESLTVTLLGPEGDVIDELVVARYGKGLPRGYYPLRFTVEAPGIYTGRTEVDGAALEMAIQVDDAGDIPVIQAGAPLPAIATPTVDDARGVDPICTSDPECPLHDVTVAQALDEGRPLALLVATPAFCQVAICGPVLDVLLAVVDDHPDVGFLHAEVFVEPAKGLDAQTAAVTDLGLTFEPCLVLVGRDGRVVERLDTIYDEVELDEALTRLA